MQHNMPGVNVKYLSDVELCNLVLDQGVINYTVSEELAKRVLARVMAEDADKGTASV